MDGLDLPTAPGRSARQLPGWVHAPDVLRLGDGPWPPHIPFAFAIERLPERRRTRIGRLLVLPGWAYVGMEVLAAEPRGEPLVLSSLEDPLLWCLNSAAAGFGAGRLGSLYRLGGYRALHAALGGHTHCRPALRTCTVPP